MNRLIRQSSLAAALLGVALLGGLNASADKLDQIASPVSNPVNFEDPRIESNIKPLFVYHKIDDGFVTQGGDVRIYALQLRYAVDDRLAIIATKDGIVDMKPDAVLDDESGLANLAGGAKYAFYKDADEGLIGTAGLRMEVPTGAKRVLQGKGAGILNPFVTGAWALGCDDLPINLVGATGMRLAFSSHDSSFWDLDLHLDTKVGPVSPLIEMNLVQVMDAGNRLPIPDEGQDFFDIGSSQANGKTMLTGDVGARTDLFDKTTWGIVYQFPLVHGAGTRITEWRITTDLTYSF